MINPDELEVTLVNPQPYGGQQVGVPNYIVTVTHIPTGISASCGYERSQVKNKRAALAMVEYGLLEVGYLR